MATLLERDADLARLAAWSAEACAGHGRVVFVGGEAGIGKTALVTTFAAACEHPVVIGRCDAMATPRALGPFLDVAAELGLDPPAGRDDLLRCLLTALRAGGPTTLIVEDAHWADDATIELLAMLGRRAADLPLLLVTTYREGEVSTGHPLRVAIGDLVTSSATAWLGLGPLSREAVAVLAAPSGVPADELYERTGGNPFYVTEALAAPGELLPPSVRLAVLARAARLAPETRAVLDAVAVVPGRAEPWLVQAIASPPSGALDTCIEAGVLVGADGTYAFRHELARLAIESQLGDEERRRLHVLALDALDVHGDVDPARLAHHAEAAGDDAALARHALEACRLAVARTAYREAVRHGEQALARRRFLAPGDVADLQVLLGMPLVAMARSHEAVDLTREAAAHWRRAGYDHREADALVVLSSAIAATGRTADAVAPIERAIELLRRHPPGRELAAAYVRLASASMLARDRDAAVAWGERAIALAAELGEDNLLGRALIETGIADVMDARFDGLTRVREGIDLGRRRGMPAIVGAGLMQIGSGCGELRRYDDAVPALEECVTWTTAHHIESHRHYGLAWLARCRFDLGQWDEAETYARDALAGPSSVISRFVALNTLGWLRARRGEPDVWPPLDEALQLATEIGHLQRLWPVAVARAEAGALAGDVEPQVTLVAETFELALRCRHGVAAGELGLWLARAGRLDAPPPGAFEPFAAWIAGDPRAAASAWRQLGCPYETASALADARDTSSLRDALATFRRLGAVPMATRVEAELRARGAPVAPVTARRPGNELSPRELEVLELVAAGFTNPQIAATLFISRKTAEHHVSSILAKLGVTSRIEAATAAVRLGLAGR